MFNKIQSALDTPSHLIFTIVNAVGTSVTVYKYTESKHKEGLTQRRDLPGSMHYMHVALHSGWMQQSKNLAKERNDERGTITMENKGLNYS